MFPAPLGEEVVFSQSMSLRLLSNIRYCGGKGSLLGPLFCPTGGDIYFCLAAFVVATALLHFGTGYCDLYSSSAFSALDCFGGRVCSNM